MGSFNFTQAGSIKGLSGSPVFVRPSVEITDLPGADGLPISLKAGVRDVLLLGLWSGSWDAPPDEVLAVALGEDVRVPVGMGIVVPADKIPQLLNLPVLEEIRREHDARHRANNAAKPDTTGAG